MPTSLTTILSFKSVLHSKDEDSNLEWLRLRENLTSGIMTLFSFLHMSNLAFLLSIMFPDINNCFEASKMLYDSHVNNCVVENKIGSTEYCVVVCVVTIVLSY